jgi:hypothetical protein
MRTNKDHSKLLAGYRFGSSHFCFNPGTVPGNRTNYTLSPAGDVNGDGYADVMVSLY